MMVRESELADVIRKPIEKSEAQKVLAHIGEWTGSTSEEWKSKVKCATTEARQWQSILSRRGI